jgi:hypothetical protein
MNLRKEMIEHRIKILEARDAVANANIIRKLKRQLNKL